MAHFKHDFFKFEDIKNVDIVGGRYYILPDGTKAPSVTTVIGYSKEFDKSWLKKWKARVGPEKAAAISYKAKERGNAIHKLIEKYVLNDADWAKGAMPINHADALKLAPILEKHVNVIRGIEIPLYSKELWTAGRCDLIAEWSGVPSIIDYKTAKKYKTEKDYIHYLVQATCYAMMAEALYDTVIPQIVVMFSVDHEQPQIVIQDSYQYRELVNKIFIDDRIYP